MKKTVWTALGVLLYFALTVGFAVLAYNGTGIWNHAWKAFFALMYFFFVIVWSIRLGKEVGM